MDQQLRRRIWSVVLIIGFFVLWEALCWLFNVSDIVLPKPSQIIVTLVERMPGAVAAYGADALHDAGRLCLRHPHRRRCSAS